MTDPDSTARVHPRAAFSHREFTIFESARFLLTVAWLMQMTAVGYQVYSLTNDVLYLGYVGLASFIPTFFLSLIAGHVADRYDRRMIMQICQVVLLCGSLALLWLARQSDPSVLYIFAILLVTGAAHAFYGPVSQALMPQLVPANHFANAVAWHSSIWQGAAVLGPALGGFFYDFFHGAAGVYAIDAACVVGAAALTALMRTRTGRMESAETSWQTLLAGLRFVRDRKVILGAISMDLFAVLLGGATALLPVFARDILKVNETGFGMMRSAPAVGAALTAVVIAYMPPMRRAGAMMLWCVVLFGLATILFGISKSFVFSLICLVIMGATDMISVVVRHTLVQIMTPAAMRGRVGAVSMVFIGASNELGEFESGITAKWFGTELSVVIGGLGTILVVILWALMFPQLRKFKRLDAAHGEE